MLEQIYAGLQALGVLTIILFAFIVASSIETGRQNDARRAALDNERSNTERKKESPPDTT
jgi:hypothetical protein